jgi:DNA helicase II / ATP-dependent DNA helicase PcrA
VVSTPIRPEQIAAAEAVQHAAAHDASDQVRVVAGPGTGKSSAVEERVRWLVADRGVDASRVFAVSFTRAAAGDLRRRVRGYCDRNGVAGNEVSVSTLHSLALRTLRAAGLLAAYPAGPMVMDEWELKNIFDAEFSHAGRTPSRSGEIRRDHEAFWSTGTHDPPNFIPPDPAISHAERNSFRAFHSPRTQTYACVLPGEIVRKCVESVAAGNLDPVDLLDAEQLIVDEFQDLNPCDLEFIDQLIQLGVATFVAGDDDQSIYSFRFASPQGIQQFMQTYAGASDHDLSDCFRCTPRVLDGATALIAAHPLPNRIPKILRSMYEGSDPPVDGMLHRWRFPSGHAEATAVATSCRDLLAAGVPAREILVLISDRRALASDLMAAFDEAAIDYEAPQPAAYIDTEQGRLALAILRLVCDKNDYVAHRIVLGLVRGVGVGTCDAIAAATIANNLNYRALFHEPLPAGVFNARQTSALTSARDFIARFTDWQSDDELGVRDAEMRQLLEDRLESEARDAWIDNIAGLPPELTLGEVRDFLWVDTDEQQADVLRTAFTRLGLAQAEDDVLPQRIRMMTMHRAKGLSARVVFIPGLEEEVFPGEFRRPYPGLVLEAARLLYVSISRARATCIVSYAGTRMRFGQFTQMPPSRFANSLAGPFAYRGAGGLSPYEVGAIVQTCGEL